LTVVGSDGNVLTLVASFTVDERGMVTSVSPFVSSGALQLAATGPRAEFLAQGTLFAILAVLLGSVLMGVRRFVNRREAS
jgi:hypothetical protein